MSRLSIACPNLEDVTFTGETDLGADTLVELAMNCPKIKSICLRGKRSFDYKLTDEALAGLKSKDHAVNLQHLELMDYWQITPKMCMAVSKRRRKLAVVKSSNEGTRTWFRGEMVIDTLDGEQYDEEYYEDEEDCYDEEDC